MNIESGFFGTALQATTTSGHEKVVQLLLDHGADMNIRANMDETVLQMARRAGREKIVQMLLNAGAVEADKEDEEADDENGEADKEDERCRYPIGSDYNV